jgi:pectate lyase
MMTNHLGSIADQFIKHTLQVTMRSDDGGSDFESANTWNWTSSTDLFLNGAFFTPSGSTNSSFWNSTIYDIQATSFVALPATMVGNVTADDASSLSW